MSTLPLVNHGRLIHRATRCLAALAVAAAALVSAAPSHADGPPVGRIAYATNGGGALATVQPDGKRARTIFDRNAAGEGNPWSAFRLQSPIHSPDGRQIAFSGHFFCDGCALEETRIAVVGAEGGTPRTVISSKTSGLTVLANPTWSADGKTLAFQGRTAAGEDALFTVPAAGGTPTRIELPVTAKEPKEPVFSPDGTRLAFSALDAENDDRVYILTLDGGAVSQLTVEAGRQQSPAWSPDSSSVAYVARPLHPGGGWAFEQLRIRRIGGGAPDTLFADDAGQVRGRPAFSPDGARVAFSFEQPGQECAAPVRTVSIESPAGATSVVCPTESTSLSWGARAAAGVTRLTSAIPGSDREGGDGDTAATTVSGDGRYAFFTSKSTNVASGVEDANEDTDVYRRDLQAGTTELVSGLADETGNKGSDMPIVSRDGRWVAFRSQATDFVTGFEGGEHSIFLKDVATGEITLASRTRDNDHLGADGTNLPVAISDDGRYVLFSSTSNNVLAGGAQGESDDDADLFRFDRGTGKVIPVSNRHGSLLASGNGATGRAFMSPTGGQVVFESYATDMVAGFEDRNGPEGASIFRRDLGTGQIMLVDGKAGADGVSTSPTASTDAPSRLLGSNGDTTVWQTNASDVIPVFQDNNGALTDVYMRQGDHVRSYLVSTKGYSQTEGGNGGTPFGEPAAALSRDGAMVTWTTTATDLASDLEPTVDHNGAGTDVYSRSLEFAPAGPVHLLSAGGDGPNHTADKASRLVAVSAGREFAVFASAATDLGLPLRHHDAEVLYRVDGFGGGRPEPLTVLGDDANGEPITSAAVSNDGNVVTYTTGSKNLLAGFLDGNEGGGDAYAWIERGVAERDEIDPTIEIETPQEHEVFRIGRPVLAEYSCDDVGSGIESCEGTVPAGQPIDTSEAGEHEFEVVATDRAGNRTVKSVHYRVAAPNNKLRLVSQAVPGGKLLSGNGGSENPTLSGDGRYLVFQSDATNVMAGFVDGDREGADVYRRDVLTGETELVSEARDGGGANGDSRVHGASAASRAISDDGRYVLFESSATDLVAGFQRSPNTTHLFIRDMVEKTTRLVDHAHYSAVVATGTRPAGFAISADGSTVVFATDGGSVVEIDNNDTEDVFAYDVAKGTNTLVSARAGQNLPGNDESWNPIVSADGKRVAFVSDATNLIAGQPATPAGITHAYWRDLSTGEMKLVDRRWDDGKPVAADTSSTLHLSDDGRTVLFQSRDGFIVQGYAGPHGRDDEDQLYRRDMVAGTPAFLVTSAHDEPTRGTGGQTDRAVMSGDGTTVVWWSMSHDVVADFVDNNGGAAIGQDGDMFVRRLETPARLAVHGVNGPNHGVDGTWPEPHGISTDGRFVAYRSILPQCDCQNPWVDDILRADLKRDRSSRVISAADGLLTSITMSKDGRRIATSTEGTNLLDDFTDGNEEYESDVFAWYDAPPTLAVDQRVTGSLTLEFDASDSVDSDGEIVRHDWTFGDNTTGEGEVVRHVYPDEGAYTVKLTIEDDGGNEVSQTFEVYAIKGILTTGAQPIDFIGIDKHLRCSVVRGGPVLASGSSACATFVALDGKTYGPPELVEGTTAYTPVSQDRSEDGAIATLVTTVALGDTGVRLRQTDAYKAGEAWYRTDVELVNTSGAVKNATVYRGLHCAIGDGSAQRSLHDAATQTAGCDGPQQGGRILAALLPLTDGARRDAGPAAAVLGRIAAGQPPADACACGSQDDPAAAIGWSLGIPANATRSAGSLAAFGPDGSIPMTMTLKAAKAEVQPLDDNAFTLTLRNPNAGELPVTSVAAVNEDSWDVIPGSTTGLTTKDPVGGAWTDAMKVAGHGTGELRFGVTHRSGQRTATTTVTPAGGVFASLAATGIADLGRVTASVVARSDGSAKPNTAITSGPTGATTNRDPEFKLEASKDEVRYECRFGDAAWAPCEGNPHRPGPLADGPYTLEARAVDGVGADETPARRTFLVDTSAPNTTIATAPKAVISEPRPAFFFNASEQGARFECSMEGPGRAAEWFACESPYQPGGLADGDWTFKARAFDAAGNPDPTPAEARFRLDTTPPVTVIDGITGKVLGTTRNGAFAATSGGAGSNVALGGDGKAALNVSCPATGPACEGTVGLATQPASASAAQARTVPGNAVTLARAEFSAQPGQTVSVRLPLSVTVRNTLERIGKMAVFTTLDLGTGRAIRGSDVILTPDPRTVRLRDAGREVRVSGGKAKLRLTCPAGRTCKGSVRVGKRDTATFSVKGTKTVAIRISKSTKRGKELAVLLKTRSATNKRLTLTLRAQEARR